MRSTSRDFPRRLTAIGALAAIAFGALFIPSAHAATTAARPAVGTPSAHYSATADASLLRANASLTGALDIADLDLTHSTAGVDSAGTPRSSASSFNTGLLAALQQQIDLSTLLARASQTAPPQAAAADENTILPLPLAPLLDAGVSNASARALWAGDNACVASDTPVALGHQDIAHATVLDQPGVGTVLGLNNDDQGASYTTGTITLPATGGPNDQRAVVSQIETRVASLDVLTLANMAPLVHVDAVGPYHATATATGLPGGATVSADDQVINISIAGSPVIQLVSGQSADLPLAANTGIPALDAILAGLAPLLDPLAQIIQVTVPPLTHSEAADGTSASLSGALLQIRVLSALGAPPLASVDIAPFAATAAAPLGGLECNPANPIDVTKNASSPTVSPGDSFNYTITATNTSTECSLTGVTVTDVITAPKGSTVTATDPAIDLSTITTAPSSDSSRELITVPFGNVGDLAPAGQTGDHKSFTITIKTSPSALPDQTFDDTATVTGNCNGTAYVKPFTLNGVPAVAVGVLAKTGADSTVPLIGAAMLALAFLGFRRLRRA